MSNRTKAQLQASESNCRVKVRSLVHDIDTNKYFIEIRFRDVTGKFQSWLASRDLQQSPRRIVEELLKRGARLPTDTKQALHLVAVALAESSSERKKITRKRGWHGDSFVTGRGTYGALETELRMEREASVDAGLDLEAGELALWRDGLRPACKCSSYLTFSLSLAFGAALLEPVGEDEGCIFGFTGESSTGKTLAARVMESVQGRPSAKDLASFEITDRGIEELCASRNDTAVTLDEAGRAPSVSAFRSLLRVWAYRLTGARGAIRSKIVARNGLPNLCYRILGLITSELSIDNWSAAVPRQPGERVRCIGIRVPPRRRGGIFDRMDDEGRRCELAAAAEGVIKLNYGVAMPKFYEWLTSDKPKQAANARDIIEKFIASKASLDPWERRFARKFGIVLAGAILAAKSGVAPWDEVHARKSIAKIYHQAHKAVLSENEATDIVLSCVRQGIDAGRFPMVKKGDTVPKESLKNRWGVKIRIGGDLIVAFSMKRLERLAGSKTMAQAVLAEFERRRLIKASADGKRTRELQIKCLTGNRRKRFICLKLSTL